MILKEKMLGSKSNDWITVDNTLVTVERKLNEKKIPGLLNFQSDLLNESYSLVKKFNLCLDVGANYGLISYQLSKKFNKVYSFEIENNVRECLKQNVKKFNLNNVKVFDFGLGEKEKNVSVIGKDSFDNHIDENIVKNDCLIKTIDSLNLNECDFIKIDCEGYEPYIILGAMNTIKKFKPVILMESKSAFNNRYELNTNDAVNYLKEFNYVEHKRFDKDVIMNYRS
jgi:FkbM family methyltransferase